MKKFLTYIILSFMIISPFLLVGCNQGNYSVADISSLYQEVLSIAGDDDGMLSSKLDISKVQQAEVVEEDKAYIFTLVYDSFIKCSSGMFFGVGQRQGKNISNGLGKLEQNELNLVYSKLLTVKSNVVDLINDKTIFETTSGDLYYRELAMSCNKLISSLYELNSVYGEIYVKYYFDDFSKNDASLTDSSLKDCMWYYLQKLSQVVYEYELKNYELTNPYGNINDWYNNTILLKNFNEIASRVINKLLQQEYNIFYEDKATIIDKLNLLQINRDRYNENYNYYIFALSKVNIKEYFLASNKTAYKSEQTELIQSLYKNIDRFLDEMYQGYVDCVNDIVYLM